MHGSDGLQITQRYALASLAKACVLGVKGYPIRECVLGGGEGIMRMYYPFEPQSPIFSSAVREFCHLGQVSFPLLPQFLRMEEEEEGQISP